MALPILHLIWNLMPEHRKKNGKNRVRYRQKVFFRLTHQVCWCRGRGVLKVFGPGLLTRGTQASPNLNHHQRPMPTFMASFSPSCQRWERKKGGYIEAERKKATTQKHTKDEDSCLKCDSYPLWSSFWNGGSSFDLLWSWGELTDASLPTLLLSSPSVSGFVLLLSSPPGDNGPNCREFTTPTPGKSERSARAKRKSQGEGLFALLKQAQ